MTRRRGYEGGDPPDWQRLALEAEAEAASHPLDPALEPAVREAIDRARRRLGGDDVAAHTIEFDPEPWLGVHHLLPDHCVRTGRISRGDVFAVGADEENPDRFERLFVASFVWGYGDVSYGPARLAGIDAETPRSQVAAVLSDAIDDAVAVAPMAAYRRLRGPYRTRAAVKRWGAAFFTKALYFGTRGRPSARPLLILDNVLASRVTELSGLPWLLVRGRGYNWSHYRYGVYLAWMGQTAEALGISNELLEFSLFTRTPFQSS